MKIINKVLNDKRKYNKFDLIVLHCPEEFGYKNCKRTNSGACYLPCGLCWDREIENN